MKKKNELWCTFSPAIGLLPRFRDARISRDSPPFLLREPRLCEKRIDVGTLGRRDVWLGPGPGPSLDTRPKNSPTAFQRPAMLEGFSGQRRSTLG